MLRRCGRETSVMLGRERKSCDVSGFACPADRWMPSRSAVRKPASRSRRETWLLVSPNQLLAAGRINATSPCLSRSFLASQATEDTPLPTENPEPRTYQQYASHPSSPSLRQSGARTAHRRDYDGNPP